MVTYELPVDDMESDRSEDRVEAAAEGVNGVQDVQADHEAGTVAVRAEHEHVEDVIEAIREAGFDARRGL